MRGIIAIMWVLACGSATDWQLNTLLDTDTGILMFGILAVLISNFKWE